MFLFNKYSIEYFLNIRPKKVKKFYLLKGKTNPFFPSLIKNNIPIAELSDTLFKQKFISQHQQKIRHYVLEVSDQAIPLIPSLNHFLSNLNKPKACVLILDQLQDPHNVGNIIRSAEFFSVDLIISSTFHSVKLDSLLSDKSSAANLYIPILWGSNLIQNIKELKKNGFWIYGTQVSQSQAIPSEFSDRVVLILGNEHKGMRHLISKNCDYFLNISRLGCSDSLNVTSAAAIFIYSIQKRLVHS